MSKQLLFLINTLCPNFLQLSIKLLQAKNSADIN